MTFKPLFTLGTAILALYAGQVQAAGHSFSDTQKSEIRVLVKDYILENPEIILEAVERYRTAEAQKEAEAQAKSLVSHMDYLTAANGPEMGNPEGDVTIVEFLDYNCGYCKRAWQDLSALLEKDKNIRVIFREMPVLGPSSLVAAKWALAAHKQGRYSEFHIALMDHRGPKNEKTLKKIAKNLGLDIDRLEKDAKSEEIAAEIQKSVAVASELGVRGTPAFVINGTFHPGYLGPEGLKNAVEKARESR